MVSGIDHDHNLQIAFELHVMKNLMVPTMGSSSVSRCSKRERSLK